MAGPRWHPDGAEGSARRRLDRLMEWVPARSDEWSPSADVIESDDGFVIRVDLAGVDAADLEVLCESDVVVVRGERTTDDPPPGQRRGRLECRYGRFERTIALPAAIDADRATAVLERGVLAVSVPKAVGSGRRHIPITRASA